jgi:hypothetical protein
VYIVVIVVVMYIVYIGDSSGDSGDVYLSLYCCARLEPIAPMGLVRSRKVRGSAR